MAVLDAIGAAAVMLLLSGLPLSPTLANFETGNSLLSVCTPEPTDSDRAPKTVSCVDYIAGVWDALELANAARENPQCTLPVTKGQLRDVVVQYLRERPERRHLSAALSVTLALREAFPQCGFLPAR